MKFRLKITICMVWMLTLAFGIGGSLMISSSFHNTLAHEMESAANSYQMTISTLQMVNSVSLQKNFSDITETLHQMQSKVSWVAVRLVQDDETLYSAGNDAAELSSDSISTGSCTARLSTNTDGTHYIQMSGAMDANGEILRLDIAFDVSSVYVTRTEQQKVYRNIFLFLIVIGALLSWTFAYFLTKPLNKLSNATKKLANGALSVRVEPRTKDEIGALSRDFNEMAQTLEANVTELQDAMERQEQFMGSFAHEMKTPMTSIIGYADLLRSQSLTQEETMDAANYIFTEGKRLEALSLKLLDLLVMKNQQIKFADVEPAQMISMLVQHLRPFYAKQRIMLQYRCEPGTCRMEPDLVKSLLTNLLDNARKAMDGGGNIYIVSDFLDGACRIRVLDNGRGIPPEALEHITEAFYRVDRSRSRQQGGVGLGLALCSRIAELHNGSIRFESRIGNGTCVTVLLKGDAI
jgi:signal transduction histidine kinase